MSPRLRRTALAACSAVAALGLAACSAGTTTGPAASGGAAASAAAATTAPADPTAGLPTGTKLAALLLTAEQVPSTLKPDAKGTRDSGSVYAEPSTGAGPAAKDCAELDGSAWISITDLNGDAFAQSDYTDHYGNVFAQEIDAFEGAGAQTVMTRVREAFTECARFKDKQNGSGYAAKLTWQHVPGLGDDAVEATTTAVGYAGGNRLIAVRVGRLVVTTIYVDQKATGGADVALTRKLVARAEAAK